MSLLKGDLISIQDTRVEPRHAFDLPDLGRVVLTRRNAEIAIFPAIPGLYDDKLRHTLYRTDSGRIHEIIDDEVHATLAGDNYLRTWYPNWSAYTAILNRKPATPDNLEGLNSPVVEVSAKQGKKAKTTYSLHYLNSRLVTYEDDSMPSHIDRLEPRTPTNVTKRFLTADYKDAAEEMLEGCYPLTVVPKGLALVGVSGWLESIATLSDSDHKKFKKLLKTA